MASSDFGRMLLVGAIRFEDRFCTSKKGGIGGGGRIHPELPCTWQLPWLAAVHVAAALAYCRKPWSALAWLAISLLFDTNGRR